jgi:hypothetical protein
MEHQKLAEEFWRNLARFGQDEAYQEYIAELARIIEPGVQWDIKGGALTPPSCLINHLLVFLFIVVLILIFCFTWI